MRAELETRWAPRSSQAATAFHVRMPAYVPTSEGGKIGLYRRTPMRTRDLRGMISDSSDPSTSDPTTEHGNLQRFQAEKRLTHNASAGSPRDGRKAGGRSCLRWQRNMRMCREFYGSDGTRTRDLRRDRPVLVFRHGRDFRLAPCQGLADTCGSYREPHAGSARDE